MAAPKNILDGTKFGRLTVIGESSVRLGKDRCSVCVCECGTQKLVRNESLRLGRTKSCGCLSSDTARNRGTTHGGSKNPAYLVWRAMLYRCASEASASFRLYGGAGIQVCDRWKDFPTFLADMGPRPSPKHSIDRIDGRLGYFPENCRWASPYEQAQNRKDNVLLTFNGDTYCVSEWARRIGMKTVTLQKRIDAGWPAEKALTTPVNHRFRSLKQFMRRKGE